MKVGLIGAGNMATALARGFTREPEGAPELLISDVDHGRARTLAGLVGGRPLESNVAVRDEAELVVLCHKPAQLEEVAEELGGVAPALASILWGTSTAALEAVYPQSDVYRFMPNIAAEVGAAVLCYAPGSRAASGPERSVLDLFGRAGTVVPLPEDLIDVAGALTACGPAFYALAAEGLADAVERRGLDADDAARLAGETLVGTAELLRASDYDTAGLRSRVATPGGVTERGLDALARRELHEALEDAVAAVVEAP